MGPQETGYHAEDVSRKDEVRRTNLAAFRLE
jgi:hypothetical protein